MKSSLCHVAMQLSDSDRISASRVSRAQYYYWRTKHPNQLELSSMEKKIADVPFRTRYRLTAATTPLAFHCYLALLSYDDHSKVASNQPKYSMRKILKCFLEIEIC